MRVQEELRGVKYMNRLKYGAPLKVKSFFYISDGYNNTLYHPVK